MFGGPQPQMLVSILPETCSCVLSAFSGIAESGASMSYSQGTETDLVK